MSAQSSNRVVVVAGDRIVDHDIYEGGRSHPAMLDRPGVRLVRRYGGPAGICELLSQLVEVTGTAQVSVRAAPAGTDEIQHAFATWRPCPRGDGDRVMVWRASLLGYGSDDPTAGQVPAQSVAEAEPTAAVDVLVLDDAGHGFRMASRKSSWMLPGSGAGPRWIVLKTSDPVARGDLWNELAANYGEQLVCIVSVDDLRRGSATISRGLSWERTVSDTLAALRGDPTLATLSECRHLVVTLSRDGALWIDTPKGEPPRVALFFDPAGAEGTWDDHREGQVTGYLTVMAASVALDLAQAEPGPSVGVDLANAVERGLRGMRGLSQDGHGLVGTGTEPGHGPDGFPAVRVAHAMAGKPDPALAYIKIPAGHPEPDPRWMALEAAQVPPGSRAEASLLGPARLIVTHGVEKVLKAYPHATFGKLTVVDRQEIEALRGIRELMLAYRDGDGHAKPLSIAVFGPPGAGKSFGVRQLSNKVFGERAWLEFNLSQFSGSADLMGPFHQVRDMVLAGHTPVVFWDEFDSQENKWLQYLLAPMQDGRFQDGPLNHAIGKCVFVFAGGTSPTYAAYSPREKDTDIKAFRLHKGPDFVSRLDAFYDVVGPNRRKVYARENGQIGSRPDPSDVSYPLRRALLIRNALAGGTTRRVEIDSDLLNALLLTAEYRHGSRSLEKLVHAMRPADGGAVQRSSLPPPDRLEMLVDATDFLGLLNRNGAYRNGESIERQAEKVHEAYLAHVREADGTVDKRLDMAYAELAPAEKEDNRAAARRTVDVLALIGLGVEAGGDGPEVDESDVAALVEHHIERLAEAEHDGWMRHRLLNGWRREDEKSFDRRTHPSLVPYSELSKTDRAKDRLMVRGYAKRIRDSDFRLVRLAPRQAEPDRLEEDAAQVRSPPP